MVMNEKKSLLHWFAETTNWFVVFVRTCAEQKVSERLQGKLDALLYKVFVPTRDYAFTKDNETSIVKRPLFGGYVFIAATVEIDEFLNTVEPLFYSDSDIYKLLSNDGQFENIRLLDRDKNLMRAILDENFNVSALKAVADGDWIEVDVSTFAGLDVNVLRVNKRRQTAVISILFSGNRTDCEIALDMGVTSGNKHTTYY